MDFENRNIAILIDYENVAIGNVEIERLIRHFSARGRLIVKRAYADWCRFAHVKHAMLRQSIDLIELPSHNSRKNQSDIRLVVEAMEIALTREYVDTFVLVSGDSDMSPLVTKLRELNRYVIVVAKSASTSSLLAGCCDEYIETQMLTDQSEETNLRLQEAEQLLIKAMHQMKSLGEQPLVSSLKTVMLRMDPAFDHRKLGFRRFSKFLSVFVDQGLLTLAPRENDQMAVLLSDQNSCSAATMKMIEEELLDRIWWAVKASQQRWNHSDETDQPLKLSRLVQLLRRLFPEFDPQDYGFKVGAGYKKMVQTLEAFNHCELIYDEHRQLCIRWNQDFLQRVPSLLEPVDFEKVSSGLPMFLLNQINGSIENGAKERKHIIPMRQLTIQLFNDDDDE